MVLTFTGRLYLGEGPSLVTLAVHIDIFKEVPVSSKSFPNLLAIVSENSG